MKQINRSGGIPLEEVRLERLKQPKRAEFAMKLALEEFEEDGDVDSLLETLRLVARAQGGLAALARKTAVSRQALSEALAPAGNPRLRTFQSVLEALGLRMSFKVVPRQRRLVVGH